MKYNKKSILVIHTAFPGDIILSLPLLRAIKEKLEPLSLYVLTTPTGAEILKNCAFISDIIVYDKNNKDRGIRGFLKISYNIRKKYSNISLAIIPHKSFRSAFLAYLSKIKTRIGFLELSNSLYASLYTKKVKRLGSGHEIEKNLKLLSPLLENETDFYKNFQINYIIPWTKTDEENVLNLFPTNFSFDNAIVIAPCSNWETKSWPIEYFKTLTKTLIKNDLKIILISSKSEKDLFICSDIFNDTQSDNVLNLSGKTSFPELSFLLSKSKLLITNDSAPMHVGASHNIPLIAIFGSTTKKLGFYPYSKKSKIIEVTLSCRPCGLHGKKKCPLNHFNCMKLITPYMVYEEAIKLLGAKS